MCKGLLRCHPVCPLPTLVPHELWGAPAEHFRTLRMAGPMLAAVVVLLMAMIMTMLMTAWMSDYVISRQAVGGNGMLG